VVDISAAAETAAIVLKDAAGNVLRDQVTSVPCTNVLGT
jgi:hypothetical protein